MKKLVIANRGEIARRVLRAAKERCYQVAVVATEDDRDSAVCREADCVLPVSSFLDGAAIARQAHAWEAHFLHPGYGFLSENAAFVEQVEAHGIVFVGPTAASIRTLGDKESAKALAVSLGIPILQTLSSTDLAQTDPSCWSALLKHKKMAPPFLVKAAGGGGGRGMRVVASEDDLADALRRASEEALSCFADDRVFLERYLENARHIEAQIFADGFGGGVFLGERECTLQRRHQKVIEEAPAACVTPSLREALGLAAMKLVRATCYRGAGTVEFLLDKQGGFYFLEMNTRLQVEHTVTEQVYRVDLVHAQLDLAEGLWPAALPSPELFSVPTPRGVALEARVLAEDPRNGFLPTPGRLAFYQEPKGPGVRVDSSVVRAGDRVNPAYDSLVAKLIVTAPTRAQAVSRLQKALADFMILGFTTNLSFLRAVATHPSFLANRYSTSWLSERLSELNDSLLPKKFANLFRSRKFRAELFFLLERADSRSLPVEVFTRQLTALPSALADDPGFRLQPTSRPARFLLWVWSGAGVDENPLGGQPFSLFAQKIASDKVHLSFLGETLVIESPDCQKQLALQAKDGSEAVLSAMAGKVVDVCVARGQGVRQNQVVCVMESMKMQIAVKSPFAGDVTEVFVKNGDILRKADPIVHIERKT